MLEGFRVMRMGPTGMLGRREGIGGRGTEKLQNRKQEALQPDDLTVGRREAEPWVR